MKTSLKASLIALAIASIPLGSQAAGLGQINVFSGLGQPLRAEIQVNATPQELQSLMASMGSADAFRRANIAYSAAAAAIRVSVDARASRPVIRLSSDRPINDPFVDLLVELNWANGRIAREYTFLLDPVDLAAARPLAAAVNAPAAPLARPQAPLAARAALAPRAAPQAYTVRRGDTLNRIATANLAPGVTLDQMLVALYRANRDAFDGQNINRLRAGEVLAIPAADAARGIDVTEARREIRAQSADFDAYRRELATATARRAPTPQIAVEQQSAGRIVPRVEESQAPADAGDQVRVSRSQPEATVAAADPGDRLQALEEELAAREKALEEATARLAQLEASVRDMQKLLEVRSGTLAQLQQQAPATEASTPAPSSTAPAASATPAAVVQAPEPMPAPPPEAPAAASATEAAAPPAMAPAATEAASVAEPEAAPPKRAVRRPPPPPLPSEPTLVESMMGDTAVVAGGAGVLALLLAYLGIKLRQRRKQQPAEGESLLGPDGRGVFASTGGQSVDTGASSILQTDFSQASLSAIDADEGVDPVAEADVYIAYGRDAQAEEILHDALKADPTRGAIYLKLLEICSQRRDLRQFETVATELFAHTNGQGSDWEKAAALGRKLDADNPLYAEARSADDALAPPTEMPAAAVASVASGATAGAAAAFGAQAREADAQGAAVSLDSGAEQPASLADLDFTSSGSIEPSQSQMRDTWTVPGDLRQFAGDSGAGSDSELPDIDQALAAIEAAEAPDLEIATQFDVSAIDFELDLGDEEAAPQALSQEVVEVPLPDNGGLTFDLEIDEPEAPIDALDVMPQPAPETLAVPKTVPAPAALYDGASETLVGAGGDIAASLDFELPDLDLQASQAERFDLNQTVLHAGGLVVDDSDDQDRGMQDADAGLVDQVAAGEVPVVDLENTSFDSSLLDFDFDIDTPVPPPPAGMGDMDLTSIDLDLGDFDAPGDDSAAVPPAVGGTQPDEAAVRFESAEPAFEASSDEVDTKLELARAYDDMGDKEGALELLEEVLREGSAVQQTAARDMIARLS
ncbi:MAG TPA: FimV/HubP family polar landmark protein [Thauera sp.]|nr:FimV/HubP family polar landmark protein [Thauera sp.]HRA80268.1 FimV/HubP family polar landmark protein [Thauera sp.]